MSNTWGASELIRLSPLPQLQSFHLRPYLRSMVTQEVGG